MKAKQVKAVPSFKTPDCFKGGFCEACGKKLRDYTATHVGSHTFCNFDHYLLWRKENGR